MPTKSPEKTRRSPRQARARATVDAILMAAAHLLKTEGAEKATTNRIAELAGVSIGSLYQYFPNKQAIWDGLRERHDEFFAAAVRDGIEEVHGGEFRSSVEQMIDRMVTLHALDEPLHREFYPQDLPFGGAEDIEYRGYLQRYLEEHADRLRPIPDPELSAFILVRALEALVHGVASQDPERLRNPHYVSELTELIVRFCGAPTD